MHLTFPWHADVTAILRDKRFGKNFIGRMTRRAGPQILKEPVYRSMSHWMLQLDPPDHGRLRGLVVCAFTARRVEDKRHPVLDRTTIDFVKNSSFGRFMRFEVSA
jgi:cytochrome P450